MSYGSDLVDRLGNSLRDALDKPSMLVKAWPDPANNQGVYPYASIQIGRRQNPTGPYDWDAVQFIRDISVRVVVAHYVTGWEGLKADEAYALLESLEVYFNGVEAQQLINEIDTSGPDYLSGLGITWYEDTGYRRFDHPHPAIDATQWGFEVILRAQFMKPIS